MILKLINTSDDGGGDDDDAIDPNVYDVYGSNAHDDTHGYDANKRN